MNEEDIALLRKKSIGKVSRFDCKNGEIILARVKDLVFALEDEVICQVLATNRTNNHGYEVGRTGGAFILPYADVKRVELHWIYSVLPTSCLRVFSFLASIFGRKRRTQ